jgi:hypothetical protein
MNVNSTVLPTAQLIAVPSGQFRPFTPFTNPDPAPGTGVHRFIYALYIQPSRFNTAGFESVGMEAETQNWNVSRALNSPRLLFCLSNTVYAAFDVADATWTRPRHWSDLFYN